jgi:hypothetical protein
LHIGGTDYLVQEYAMQTGSRQEMTMTCGQYGCTPIVYPVPITAPYYLIYRKNRLVTWGHLEELNRSDDPQILAVTDQISRKSKN